MKVEVNATIVSISEIVTGDNGHKRLTFRAKTLEDYSQTIEVKLYKKAEYAEHVDNFVKYNKIGDKVALELSVQCNEYQDKIFTNLNLWKISKIEGEAAPKLEAEEIDLPF